MTCTYPNMLHLPQVVTIKTSVSSLFHDSVSFRSVEKRASAAQWPMSLSPMWSLLFKVQLMVLVGFSPGNYPASNDQIAGRRSS